MSQRGRYREAQAVPLSRLLECSVRRGIRQRLSGSESKKLDDFKEGMAVAERYCNAPSE